MTAGGAIRSVVGWSMQARPKTNVVLQALLAAVWDERFAAISKEYPRFKTDQFHIDILTAHFVRNPDWFDVVVGSNLFGAISAKRRPRSKSRTPSMRCWPAATA